MVDILKTIDGDIWHCDAPNWNNGDSNKTLRIGISKKGIANRAGRGQLWSLGQLYGVVATGLIFTQHVFQGLRRPMFVEGNKEADEIKQIFTWKAQWDARLLPDASNFERFPAEPGTVFFVHVSPCSDPTKYSGIYGWADHWGWVKEDGSLPGAPIDYGTRYDKRIWSRTV